MLSLSRPQLSQFAVASTVALLCLIAIGGLQLPRLNKLIEHGKTASVDNIKAEVELERQRLILLQKAPSLGFDNLIANWVYLGFLQYFGDDEARDITGFELSPAYFEIIVDRDPRFLAAYIPLTSSISLYAGKPELSVALMAKGLKSMSPKIPPQSYFVWRYKAVDELLFLADIKSAQRSFAMAAQWASLYPDDASQNLAALSHATAQFLAGNPDKKRIKNAQEGIWASVIVNTLQANDRRTLDQVIRQIEARGGKVTITPEGGVSVQLP